MYRYRKIQNIGVIHNDKLCVVHITIYTMHINLNEQKARRFFEDESKRKKLAKGSNNEDVDEQYMTSLQQKEITSSFVVT